MEEQDCGSLPVVDARTGKLVGIVTDRDIVCRAVARGKDPRTTHARECMSDALATVRPDSELEECCQLMESEQVRRVPVVDHAGKCCGIVAQADIARRAPENKSAEVLKTVSQPSSHGSWAHTLP
jgi:CBS domain-containing protein